MAKQFSRRKNGRAGAASIVVVVLSVLIYFFNWGSNAVHRSPETAGSASEVKGLRVHYIDVDQGDSILIQCDGENLLIDAGKNDQGQRVINYLRKEGIKKLDMVVGTHPHEDHIGGMDWVIDEFEIGKIVMPEISTNTRSFEDLLNSIDRKGLKVEAGVSGKTYKLGGADISILSPKENLYEDMNDNSIVLRLVYGKRAFLFTGDAGELSEVDMLSGGAVLKSDVLKVGHHGSKYSTGKDFLDAVSPSYGVISVGKNNEYGHPAEKTMRNLAAAGVTVYRTDLNGNIIFKSDGTNLEVESEK